MQSPLAGGLCKGLLSGDFIVIRGMPVCNRKQMTETETEHWAPIRRIWRSFVWLVRESAKAVLSILDWLVNVTERLTVLGIACVVTYLAWRLLHSPVDCFVENTLRMLSENWKALLLLLIPLFYRAVNIFLGKLKKLGPLEAEPQEKREAPESKGE